MILPPLPPLADYVYAARADMMPAPIAIAMLSPFYTPRHAMLAADAIGCCCRYVAG